MPSPHPLRILIVPDKFKGTLTAEAAARAIARGWRRARPQDRLTRLPMTDGGDGFGAVLGGLIGTRHRRTLTVNAAHQPIQGLWSFESRRRLAVIESARTIGLMLLPPGRFHPFDLDTLGLGRVMQAAAQAGARTCLIGIGGSATNDGGFGLARALGWRFLDAEGTPLERWPELHRLERIDPPAACDRLPMDILVAVDVQNPLLGARGATRVYGPQKGLRPDDLPAAEGALRRLAGVVRRQFRQDFARWPGAGAAGGLGFGLFAFLGARPVPGVEVFARYARLDARLRCIDLVITGEGALDRSTLMGKGVGEVARRCRQLRLPCLALGGRVADARQLRRWFTQAHGLTELTTEAGAQKDAALWLARLAQRVAKGRVFV